MDSDTTTSTTTGAPTDTTTAQTDSNVTGAVPEPTVTETSRAGEMTTSAGGREAALISLAKAKNFDAAGQEEACMTEVSAAKAAIGMP